MNEPQRTVLQTQMRNIAKGIIMSEDLMSSLFEKNIFEPHMMEIIRAAGTGTEQTYKMLELLPKRGPKAFDAFIEVIQQDYPWLATSLQSRCQSEMERYSSRLEQVNHKIVGDQTEEIKKLETENGGNDIRKKVSTFVHKHFGHSKKLAEKDKKLIVIWMTNQITDERMRLQSVTASETGQSNKDSDDGDVFKLSKIKAELFKLHLKLEPHLIRYETEETDNVSQPVYISDDMSFTLIQDEIDQMWVCMSRLQDEIDGSLDQFDSSLHQNGLKVLVESLLLKYNNQNEQLDKEGKRNTELIDDLSDYSEQIHKLETERAKMRYQIDLMHKELSLMRHDKFHSQENSKHLENLNRDKDNKIENLQAMVRELQVPKSKKDASEASRSPVRKSKQSVGRSINFNTPLFSRRASQYYTTNCSRPPSQKKPI